jgi:hypothetical protein
MLDSLTCERWGRREGRKDERMEGGGWRGEDGGGRMERRGGGRMEGRGGGRMGKGGWRTERREQMDSGKIGKRRVLLNPRSCREKKRYGIKS